MRGDVSAQDPVAFVRATTPFEGLPQPLFDRAARALEVGFFPAGTRLVRAGGEPLQHLYVIRKGAVRLERDGQTLQVLEDGEIFGYASLLAGAATADVVVEEDLLAYLLPGAEFARLRADARFASHFTAGLAERLRSSIARAPTASAPADLSRAVEELLRGPAIWIDEGATVGDAARVMHAERISSVLVRGATPGIATDRDFRSRVLAQGLGPETPLARVTSRPLRTIAAASPVYDAWATLLDAGVHHLAVTRRDEIVGVLTSGDLLRYGAHWPVAVLRELERLAGRDRLAGYAARVTEMTTSLVAGGLDVQVVAGLVARVNDALVRRVLAWAEADLGPPPAPYAWIALGSEGRMEQTLLTDQDNALVYADEGTADAAWFQALAARAKDDLAAAGFPRCARGYMAYRWVGPRSEWEARFAGWFADPTPAPLVDAGAFLDFRKVAGALDLAPLERACAAARAAPFLPALARAALAVRPPAGIVLRLRGESSTLDLKATGILPMVLLARCHGLAAGSAARGTVERLGDAARAGLLDAAAAAELAETYRFLLTLRLREQLAAIAAGRRPSDAVALAALPGMQRSRLKEAFREIRAWQERSADRFPARP
jgi:CBS domain-containing protein